MQALVGRYVILIRDAEWTRPFTVYAWGGAGRSNRPSPIEFRYFPFWSSTDLETGKVSKVPPEGGEDFNPCSVTAGSFPFATPWGETRSRKVG
jgi:hypothetical protein